MYQQILLLFSVVAIIIAPNDARQFIFENKLDYTIYPASLENSGGTPVLNGGWTMEPNTEVSTDVPDGWAGRFWGRTGCGDGDGGYVCVTGNCNNLYECQVAGTPPVTLIEIKLNDDNNQDYYDASLVDGFNVPMTITPLDPVTDGTPYRCTPAGCTADVNGNCPEELKQYDGDQVVACKSACLAFDTDQYCCRNDYGTPETCQSSSWPQDYPATFKSQCPQAYSYAYDDQSSLFTCENTGYRITFG